jgi:hypothetical protein
MDKKMPRGQRYSEEYRSMAETGFSPPSARHHAE